MLSYWKICIFFGVFSCIVWETFQDCVFQGSRIDLLSPGLFRISQQFKKRQTALPVWIEVVGKVTVFSAFQGAWGGNCQGRSIFPNILKKGEGKCQGPAGLRRFRHFPRTLIAAAVVAVLFGLGSMAGSSRLWESVVHLTQGTLQIVPPGASQSGQTSAQPPLEELEFTSLQEALDAYGITEPLVPKWLPEGFESRDVIISVDPDFIRIIAVYQYGEKEIKVTVRRYNSEDALERFSLEKQEGQQDTKYTKDGVVHSIAQNNAACTASWTNGLNMASIMGDVTEEELEQMIDSIYT